LIRSRFFHIGTSGWSYSHWKNRFYPEGLSSKDFLSYYSSFFSCVELNASFYRLPSQKTVENWYNNTPQDFVICPKMSRLITHVKKLEGVENYLQDFFSVFKHLKNKIGPILILTPPNMVYEPEIARNFFALLKKKYGKYHFAFEARDPSWFNEELFSLLSRSNISWVIADSGKRYISCEMITAQDIYFRFHGREELYASLYTKRQLAPYVKKVAAYLKQGHRVWAFFNNDAEAFAVKNALSFKEMLSSRLLEESKGD
jgi:uncharacterized protein YecE (DUF72 family)